LAEGRLEGLGEFISIADNLLQTAKKMKAEGMSIDMISKVTGWCKEELAGL